MLPFMINIKTGYSIDYNHEGEDRCPCCSGKVYHVNEDDYIVFCTALGCQWRDRTFYPKGVSYYEMQLMDVRNQFEQAFILGSRLHLKRNYKYPLCKYPVIIMGDVCAYRCIIRDFDFNYDFFDGGYNKETTPIARYSTMDEMIRDGWRLD